MNWADLIRENPPGLMSNRLADPVAALLTLEDVKAHLRVFGDDDDDQIAAYIAAATDYLDAAQGVLGRPLVNQRWRASWSGAPRDKLVLPFAPVSEIEEIKYLDPDGDEATLDSAKYSIVGGDGYAAIELASGETWPSVVSGKMVAIWVDFVAGYGALGSDVPEGILQCARLLVGSYYENREAIVVGTSAATIPLGVQTLIAAHRHPRTMF